MQSISTPADSSWNSSVLFDTSLHGLSLAIIDQLIATELPEELDSLSGSKRLLEQESVNRISGHCKNRER